MPAAEPDPSLLTRFCDEVVPSMLVEGCDVGAVQAAAIGADVLSRAWSFAALGDSARDVLMAPFVEEVFDHEPANVPAGKPEGPEEAEEPAPRKDSD